MSRWALLLLLGLVWPAAATTLSETAFRQLERAQALLAEGDARAANELLEARRWASCCTSRARCPAPSRC